MPRIQGCLEFSWDKTSVSFMPVDSSSDPPSLPWNALAGDQKLLRSFIQCAHARRIDSGRGTFSYEIDCSTETVEEWFMTNLNVNRQDKK